MKCYAWMHPSCLPDCLCSVMDWAKCQIACKYSILTWRLINRPAVTCFCYESNVIFFLFFSFFFFFFAETFFSDAQCPVCFTFSVLLWGSPAHLFISSLSHHLIFFLHSSFHKHFFFLPSLPFEIFPLFWLVCFYVFSSSPPCWFVVCYVPSCATDLHHRLQWVALSGLWVWALPPQALQPLAGCTGAFPGQVPSTTCVPPQLPPSRKLLV